MSRQQNGYLFQRSGAWYVRYWERRTGQKPVRRNVHLGYLRDYPTKTSILPVLRKEMDNVNGSSAPSVTLSAFIEYRYLPWAKNNVRPSTHWGYVNLYNSNLRGLPEMQYRVREYRPSDIQAILATLLARRATIGKVMGVQTLSHVKAFLSGVFRFSILHDIREMNPVREARIPKGGAPMKKTAAYTLEEIEKMLVALQDKPGYQVAVAIGGFAGLRLAELKGLDWIDYDGRDISIRKTVWKHYVSEPKTDASKDYVPVIPKLRAILDNYKISRGVAEVSILPSLINAPRDIRLALKDTGVTWRGWHALRRGLATNLAEMGCSDKVIQRILRHARVTVTREHYIKVRDSQVDEAMERLSSAIASDGPNLGPNDTPATKPN